MIYALLILIIATLVMIILILACDMAALKAERDAYRDEVLRSYQHPKRLSVIGYKAKGK